MVDALCRNCQEFHGHRDGLCSKCSEALKVPASVDANTDISQETISSVEERKVPVDRCAHCQRRMGPLSFSCKCSAFFCSKHRLPEQHECQFDHQGAGKRKLSENNPQVIAEKFNRIK